MSEFISNWYSRRLSQKSLRRVSKAASEISGRPFIGDVAEVIRLARATRDEAVKLDVFRAVRHVIQVHTGLTLHSCQIMGGLVLTERKVAEMKTGEGKTLTLVAPVVWRALEGRGVHVVTANPYLAQRDSAALRPVYEALGLTVGCILPSMDESQRRQAYACDITYGVSSEFGFDFLRDLRVRDLSRRVQRGLHSAFVDELDAVLIDDARTPLILSALGTSSRLDTRVLLDTARKLVPGLDYVVEEKSRAATLTDSGYQKAEALLVSEGVVGNAAALYDATNVHLVQGLARATTALSIYLKGRDYLVANGTIVLLDTSTGRALKGRRLEDGLHEMLEAKEGVAIQQESQTLGTTTYQNFFGRYAHLCGLTGTAATEAEELLEVYGLQTVVLPTNRPVRRELRDDVLCMTRAEKVETAVETARSCAATGQPLLIGTGSVRDAYTVHQALVSAGLQPSLLTAEHVEQEADLIAEAGKRGALTVATSVAGRGTDITLGGHNAPAEEVEALNSMGGLFVLGFERNALRRVDLQLMGRCARQGDRGTSQFLVSLEDDILRAFGESSALSKATQAFGGGASIVGPVVSRLVQGAQKAAERQGFEARRSLQQFDRVLSDQQDAFFQWRQSVLPPSEAKEWLTASTSRLVEQTVRGLILAEVAPTQWPLVRLKAELRGLGIANAPVVKWLNEDLDVENIVQRATALSQTCFDAQDSTAIRDALLDSADKAWSDYLGHLESLKFTAGLSGKIGKNPSVEFALRAFAGFEDLMAEVALQACGKLFPVVTSASEVATVSERLTPRQLLEQALEQRWVTRNEPCPCGSGRRYKNCHGQLS